VFTSHKTIYGYKYSLIWTEKSVFFKTYSADSPGLRLSRSSVRSEETGLFGLTPVRPDCKFGLSRLIPVSRNYRKVACPNEVLSDYFMKFRSREWSFASLFYENQIM